MTERRRGGALASLVAMLLLVTAAGPAAAARYEPIEVDVASFTVNAERFDPLDDDRLGIIIDLVGAGAVDCLDNAACAETRLAEVTVRQRVAATLDTSSGRARGRIVIDVISAGFSVSFSGPLSGTLARGVDAGRWDLVLLARTQAEGGARASFELQGVLARTASGPSVFALRGLGLVSIEDMDEI